MRMLIYKVQVILKIHKKLINELQILVQNVDDN